MPRQGLGAIKLSSALRPSSTSVTSLYQPKPEATVMAPPEETTATMPASEPEPETAPAPTMAPTQTTTISAKDATFQSAPTTTTVAAPTSTTTATMPASEPTAPVMAPETSAPASEPKPTVEPEVEPVISPEDELDQRDAEAQAIVREASEPQPSSTTTTRTVTKVVQAAPFQMPERKSLTITGGPLSTPIGPAVQMPEAPKAESSSLMPLVLIGGAALIAYLVLKK